MIWRKKSLGISDVAYVQMLDAIGPTGAIIGWVDWQWNGLITAHTRGRKVVTEELDQAKRWVEANAV